jgi:hypothetical protein
MQGRGGEVVEVDEHEAFPEAADYDAFLYVVALQAVDGAFSGPLFENLYACMCM